MRQSARDILDKHQIQVNSLRGGNQVTRCPQCSHNRKKKRVPCLSVLIDEAGIRWRCHHCSWQGGEFFETAKGDYRSSFHGPSTAQQRHSVQRAYR